MSKLENNKHLIEALKRGNEQAYVYLVDHFHKRLFAQALSLTADPMMSEDIVQTVFIRTWEFRNKLNPAYSLSSFLHKSVYNAFVNQYWKEQSIHDLEEKYAKIVGETAEYYSGKSLQELIHRVRLEVGKLPPKCQRIFLLSKEEGLDNMEISEYLKISKRTVETQISRAYKILRRSIDLADYYF